MKIAIYTIAKNESHNVSDFAQNCLDADYVLVGDTGSTDETVQLLEDNNVNTVLLNILPWRFDTARNAVLSLLPADIDLCIPLDLDERLPADWRDILENAWDSKYTRVQCRYAHNVLPDGSYSRIGIKKFIHTRGEYLWRHRVHEDIYYVGERNEKTCSIPNLLITHHQAQDRDGTRYHHLLDRECRSRQGTPRHIFWLARDKMQLQDWKSAQYWFQQYLNCEDLWAVEKGHAHRFYANACTMLQQHTEARTHYQQATIVAPRERDIWLDAAGYYIQQANYPDAFAAISHCLAITNRPEHYLSSPRAWGHYPHELAAVITKKLGMQDAAQKHIMTAVRLAPDQAKLRQLYETIQRPDHG